ncbi:MFS transporter [Proteus mirabilis]
MTKYVIFSFFLVLIYPLGVDLYLTGLTAIASDLNASEVTLHHAFSIYLMGMMSSMLIAGWCSDNLGRKPIILFGTLIFFLASLSAGLSITEKQFLISRFFQGSRSGFCYVVTFAILRDTLTEQQRAKVLSMINGITCIIPVLAPVLGFIILLYCEWSMMFYLMGAYSLLVFIFCFLGIKETYHKKEFKNKKVNLSVIKPTTDSFFTRYFLSRLLISCLGMAVILTYVNISPIVVMQQMNYSTGEYSILMTSLAMISMTISFLMPKILMKYRYKHILSVGFICFGIGIIFLFIGKKSDMRWFFITFALCGSGFALLFGIIMSQALSPFSQRAGVASSVLGISQLSFSSLYIWVMGWIEVSSINMLVVILFISCIVGTLFLCFPRFTEQKKVKYNV